MKFENRFVDLICSSRYGNNLKERFGGLKIDTELKTRGRHTILLPPSSILGLLPVPATVTAERLDQPAVQRICESTNVFRMIGVEPGRYRITIQAKGYQAFTKVIEVKPKLIAKVTGIVLRKTEN